jgi:hypothetical protein
MPMLTATISTRTIDSILTTTFRPRLTFVVDAIDQGRASRSAGLLPDVAALSNATS